MKKNLRGSECNAYGDNTFDYEEPSPAWCSVCAFKVPKNSGSEEASEHICNETSCIEPV
jgi:hypothetical protein